MHHLTQSVYVSREKPFNISQVLADRRRRKRFEEAAAVPHGLETRIEDREHSSVVAMANEPPKALQHRQNRERHLIFVERVATACRDGFDASGSDGIAGRRKWQLVDDHTAQLVADDIHTLPEG